MEVQAKSEKDITSFLNSLFKARTQLLISNSSNIIDHYYSQESKNSWEAFEHERKRRFYLQSWAKAREIHFLSVTGDTDIEKIKIKKNKANVELSHHTVFTYHYKNQPFLFPTNTFAIRTWHKMTLIYKEGQWKVKNDVYADPIEDNPSLIPKTPMQTHLKLMDTSTNRSNSINVNKNETKYNRRKAVKYANNFSGASLRHNNKYNPDYLDFTYKGGDCTNFVSQVLGDPNAGGLPMNDKWFYNDNKYSSTWIRTDSFKDFLINNGYGKVIKSGSFHEIAKKTKTFPNGAINTLQQGDLIGYEVEGDITHFSVVTSRDSQGYLTVNSHTADRYHVPWDLGWGRETKFWLIHITR